MSTKRLPNIDPLTAFTVALARSIQTSHPPLAVFLEAGERLAWHLLPKEVVTEAATICALLGLTEDELVQIFRAAFRGVPDPIPVGEIKL